MKTKIRYICFILSVVLNLVMAAYLVTWEPKCDRAHPEEIDRTKDVVPNEAAAEKIARYSIREGGPAGGFALSGDENFVVYDADVTFIEQTNEWIVDFTALSPEGEHVIIYDGISLVGVRRDNGWVTWYADLDEIPGYYEIWEGKIEEWRQKLQ